MSDRVPFYERDLSADPEITALMSTLALRSSEAESRLEARAAALARDGRRFHLAYALAMLARARALQGKLDAAEADAERARRLFREEGAVSGEALVLHALAMRHLLSGKQASALEDLSRAMPLARGSGWPDLQAFIHNMLGVVLSDMGRHEEAASVLREGLDLPGATVSDRLRARLRSNLALALARGARRARRRGDGQGRARADEAVAEARQAVRDGALVLPGDRATFLDTLAAALVEQGELAQAHAALDEAETLFVAIADDCGLFYGSLTRAQAWLDEHRPALALAALARGRAAAARSGITVMFDELELLASQAHEQLGDLASALASYKAFHHWRETQVLVLAEERARSLAVTLDFDRANRESRQDCLTGLLNRRGFQELFARVLTQAEPANPVSVALIDVDHFKQVNDRHGHAAGDEALRVIAKLLVSECRATDFAARLGGDEFVVVVRGERDGAAAVCRRVLARLEGHRLVPGDAADAGDAGDADVEREAGVRITISAGVAQTDRPVAPEALLKRADEALYRVKQAGRRGVFAG